MDLSFIVDYYMPVILATCLIVGYCIKHISWLDRISNEYIPTILVILGAGLACASNGSISLEIAVSGAFSGLVSTGLHQAFKQIVNGY